MMGRNVAGRLSGVTLIELMIALVLGLLVAGGIVTLFIATSASHRAQDQLAQVQENGRYAVRRITDDLRMANGQYCSSTGGVASSTGSGLLLDGLRAPTVYARDVMTALGTQDLTTRWGQTSGSNTYPATPTAPYSLPSFLSMRGYDCDDKTCKPINPPTSVVPAMGKASGSRVPGTGIVTLRYVDSSRGWALGGNSWIESNLADGSIAAVHVVPGAGEPLLTEFKPGDLAMLADCSSAQIFAVSGAPDFVPVASLNFAAPAAQSTPSAPRLFDFNTDYVTVTYYVKAVANDDGTLTGALVRKQGGTSEEVVRGVERLDFLYGIEDANGNTRYLTADEIDSNASGSIACPPSVPLPLGSDPGCLWRAVKSIEVRLLVAGERPLFTLTENEQMYAYAIDGMSTPAAPGATGRKITPVAQGFVNPKIRREFTALVSVRNYNP
ncbi:PilW family protein [Dyella sp. EPa41]|uniref:PilW family protein n=1 Tax=Dyella sp. EPa41 TaxID=1561194 RepID=UPI001915FDC1|nr:PilW family protein [Dyella sp. EPa41]